MAYLKITGIYKIHCRGSGKFYIGSAVSINGRWASHRSNLQRGRHSNKHLQNAWNKYGADSFEFSVIERCELDALVDREQYWIDTTRAADPKIGMNNSPTASTSIGFRHSEETKRLLSEVAAKRDHTRLRKLSEAMRGKPSHNKGKPGTKWTEEQRAAASLQRKGRIAWNKGVPHTEEAKEKISRGVAGLNRKISDDVRETIKRLRESGMSYTKIAAATSVSISHCSKIYNDNTGRYVAGRTLRSVEKVKGVAK